MAPVKQGAVSMNPDEDDESYIEEVIIDSDDETLEEEEFEEEEVIEVEEDDSDDGSRTFMDDSTAPPASLGSIGSFDDINLMSFSAVNEGARKAMEEELEREKSIRRQTARDALVRQRILQEATLRAREKAKSNEPETEEEMRLRQRIKQEAAHRRLAQTIEKMNITLSKKKKEPGIQASADAIDRRKKALADLRRQAARDELARNNFKLKAAKASKSVAGSSHGGSAVSESASGGPQAAQQEDLSAIKAIEISKRETPLSPLRSKDDPSRSSNKEKSPSKPVAPWELRMQQNGTFIKPSRRRSVTIPSASPTTEIGGDATDVSVKSHSSTNSAPVVEKEMLGGSRYLANGTPKSKRNSFLRKDINPDLVPASFRAPLSPTANSTAITPKQGRRRSLNDYIPTPSQDKKNSVDSGILSKISSYEGMQSPRITPNTPKRPSYGRSAITGSINLPTMFQGVASPKPASTETEPSSVNIANGKYYSLSELQRKTVVGIDYSQREQYLSPADFEARFKMTKEEFAKLPKWKRDKAKSTLKLF